jgi:CoA-transferase family III
MSVGNALTGWQGTRGRAMTNGPLDRLRVIEAGTLFSAPFAGMMLSDLGADVIKVEPPDNGDGFRSFSKPAQGISADVHQRQWRNEFRNRRPQGTGGPVRARRLIRVQHM